MHCFKCIRIYYTYCSFFFKIHCFKWIHCFKYIHIKLLPLFQNTMLYACYACSCEKWSKIAHKSSNIILFIFFQQKKSFRSRFWFNTTLIFLHFCFFAGSVHVSTQIQIFLKWDFFQRSLAEYFQHVNWHWTLLGPLVA